jgi:hypothetical protein
MHNSSFVVAIVAIAPPLFIASCSAWDPAVGVRCEDFPSFCRAADGGAGASDAAGGAVDAGPPVSFKAQIRPLMNRSETDPTGPGCSMCHYRGTGTRMGINEGQLDLTTLGTLRKGGKTSAGHIVIPGNPNGSAIVQKLRGTYGIGARMPWNGPPYWTDAEIDLVVRWILQGAQGADDE